MQPSISVIIPTFNYGRFMCAAVDSVLAQTLPPREVIVVDDGSTDDTQQKLAPYGGRIHYVYQKNRGVNAARNLGIKLSHGDWIAILDSDDAWHPQKLERQMAVHHRFPDLAASSTTSLTYTGTSPFPAPTVSYSGTPQIQRISLTNLLYGIHFSGGSGAMIKRQCFAATGMFDELLRGAEDLEMWCRIANQFTIAKLLEPLTIVRDHPASVSSQAAKMEAYHRVALERLFGGLPQLPYRWLWKRLVLARMHRGVAGMHFEAHNRSGALRSLGRSFIACPLMSGQGRPLIRLRMTFRYLLP